MELELRQAEDEEVEFLLKNATPAKANALRRALITEVPSLAIEDVKIYENSSVLFDEILALRLGLVPLRTDLNEFVLPQKCECEGEGCSACQTKATLAGEGPTTLYSKDLETEPGIEVPYKDIPIVELGEGQELILEATAQMGKGKQHTKWQPTVACGYKTYPIQEIAENCENDGACIKACPKDVYAIEDEELKVINQENCIFCEECVKACPQDALTIKDDDTKYIFNFETDKSIPTNQLLKRGAEEITQKLKKFQENL